ncbi:unnamed protein product [Parascedosporium putredinis]|uniref:Metallo-beta-lactamase domain-containing protein n=1 Tax=Parascedosporium putredinis TaxID=1442378 RepID=A0A9P1GZR1_9PEZI|nr:unnamed protein product [Parascedosporium putredinis]CAI7992085.1 unnamed protein product [Parascedosporium putredinis]
MAFQISPLQEVQRLGSACIRILGGNPGKFTLQGTNTYLLGTGRRRLLIDTGEGRSSWKQALEETLIQEGAVVERVLITHWHPDHTRGIPDVMALCPEAAVFKFDPEAGQAPIADGQTFTVDGVTLVAYHTPGHTEDHVIFVFTEERSMFTGDNILGHGTAVFEDLSSYLGSLERMKGLFTGRAYPGHGPVVEDGPLKILEYLQHRQDREAQVVKLLTSARPDSGLPGPWTITELVQTIYSDIPTELHLPASRGVLQILAKLEGESRVIRERNMWRL